MVNRDLEIGKLSIETISKLLMDLVAAETKGVSADNQMNEHVWPALNGFQNKLKKLMKED